MLVVDISINRIVDIGELKIVRMTKDIPEDGICKYVIKEPEGFEEEIILHNYDDGYLPLLGKCIDFLLKQGYKPVRKSRPRKILW